MVSPAHARRQVGRAVSTPKVPSDGWRLKIRCNFIGEVDYGRLSETAVSGLTSGLFVGHYYLDLQWKCNALEIDRTK